MVKKSLIFGLAFCMVVAMGYGILQLAFASEKTSASQDKEFVTVFKSFETVDKKSALKDETINITSSGNGQWVVSDLTAPFRVINSAVRASSGTISRQEWGNSQWTRPVAGNTYVPGQCTWYVYNRRVALGRSVGSFWGNGGYWHYSAANAGYLVNHMPEVGAVFEQSGHVAVVEEIGIDNSVRISEMNYLYIPYNYNERWVTDADQYWYIH
ncbi:MAG: CHAP domain-containing protein [Candidatus Ancillula sp.]|nr:CHAP domain-containing protein [Candidatus Ancillula sp.]